MIGIAFLLLSCSSTRVTHPKKVLVFVQSEDIISSRVAQDRIARISPFAAYQGYQFNKTERLLKGNQDYFLGRLYIKSMDGIMILRLVETGMDWPPDSSGFFHDYFQYIDSIAYHPLYKFVGANPCIEVSLYQGSDGKLVRRSRTKPVKKDFPAAFEKAYLEFFR